MGTFATSYSLPSYSTHAGCGMMNRVAPQLAAQAGFALPGLAATGYVAAGGSAQPPYIASTIAGGGTGQSAASYSAIAAVSQQLQSVMNALNGAMLATSGATMASSVYGGGASSFGTIGLAPTIAMPGYSNTVFGGGGTALAQGFDGSWTMPAGATAMAAGAPPLPGTAG